MDRRGLFGSLAAFGKRQEQKVIRPPYFSDTSDWNECRECSAPCLSACEEKIIILDAHHSPILDLSKSGCTYCDACALACEVGVLNPQNRALIDAKIEIDLLKCLSWHSTMCFSCKDPCLDDAIKFFGMFRPEIDDKRCTNCGFCIKNCPVGAIVIKERRG
ncbi:MAG: 4Fe-4S binding protein [Epsilonproteobacteria bacterium]|nr:4Fe-4S binding protein [Campylobacterota bacterium]